MKYFTSDELKPSENTLSFIRQLAHTYRVVNMKDTKTMYCLN